MIKNIILNHILTALDKYFCILQLKYYLNIYIFYHLLFLLFLMATRLKSIQKAGRTEIIIQERNQISNAREN